MKPGLRKVAALILASVTLFGSGASVVSAAYADDTTMGTSTRIQAEPDVKTTTGGDEAATKPDAGSGDEAGTGADKQSDTGAPAQSAPQADAGQAAPDVTVHDMLDTDSAAVSRLRLTDRITGTAPFDKDNERGDDKDENNDIVRSYDTVTYDYEYTLTPDSTMDYYRRTRVGFRFELPYPKDKVTFDAEKMGWVDHTPGYEPKLTTETIDGTVTQVYTCYRLLEPTSQSPTVNPGTEDAKTHRLVAAVSYSNGEGGEDGILFRNTYQPGNVMVGLAARKNLTGRGLKADEFEFELVDKDGKVIDSARNDKDGDIRFKPLTYGRDNNGIDDCGEHRYVIRERNTGEKNVTYDRTEHHVTVTVGDDLQGNLTAKVEYDPTDGKTKDSGAMPATPTDKADKTKGDAVGDKPSTTPGVVTTTGTRPEFTNSYIPPATPAIVKTIRQLAKTGVSTPTVALAAFTLLGVGLMLFRRRGNQTETARHRK